MAPVGVREVKRANEARILWRLVCGEMSYETRIGAVARRLVDDERAAVSTGYGKDLACRTGGALGIATEAN
jgi:hypothetical protein